MKKKFLLGVLLSLLFYNLYADNYYCTLLEKILYQNNKIVIDSIVDFRANENLIKLNNQYYIPVGSKGRMEYYVRNREFRLVCQEFLYKNSLRTRMHNKIKIENRYQDSINTILIPTIENHVSGENVSFALYCSKILKLDKSQYDYIMSKALEMARRIRKDYRTNLWNEEMELLKKTLSKKQLRSFFVNKYSVKVTNEFNKTWEVLSEAGLTEQLDSVKDANEAVNYMFNMRMIKDLYRNYGTTQKKHVAELNRNMPKIISMMRGLEKNERIRNEKKDKIDNKIFIW